MTLSTYIFLALIRRQSSPVPLIFWSVIGFCAGIGLFFYGFRLLQRRRLILDTPLSKIRSASMGMVEISGLAVGPYTMIAPITARPCYYYRTLVWEYKQSGKNKQWVKVAGECMHVPFFVDDNTGHMLIDPRGADLDLHRDFEEQYCDSFFTTKEPAPGNVRSFLARHGVATNNRIKVEEYCIKPKNSLFILGTLAENPGIEVSPQPVRDAEPASSFTAQGFSLSINSFSFSGSSDEEVFQTGSPSQVFATQREVRSHEVIRLSPGNGPTRTADMTQQQKVAAALLKAGISNPAAWAAGGVSTPGGVQVMTTEEATPSSGANGDSNSSVISPSISSSISSATSSTISSTGSSTQASGFETHPPVVLMKGTNNKTFLISWRSQQEVARSLGWKCTLMIWGGPMLALLCLYLFLGIEHLL